MVCQDLINPVETIISTEVASQTILEPSNININIDDTSYQNNISDNLLQSTQLPTPISDKEIKIMDKEMDNLRECEPRPIFGTPTHIYIPYTDNWVTISRCDQIYYKEYPNVFGSGILADFNNPAISSTNISISSNNPVNSITTSHVSTPKESCEIAISLSNLSIALPESKSTIIPEEHLKIVILLDESESMEPHREETIKAINAFIDTQKNAKVDDDCRVTLIAFDHNYRVVIDDIPLNEIKPLTNEQYKPNGCTALYDAIGITIQRICTLKKVVFVIVTDGRENSSKKYSRSMIKSLITRLKNIWNIIYLSADPLLADQGNDINIVHESNSGTSNCYTNFKTLSGYCRLNLGKAISEFRLGKFSRVLL